MTLAEAAGRRYGPVAVPVAAASVASFVAATGDDRRRWSDHAPPSYAAAALFAVAPAFLSDGDVAPETRSLIHTEQSYTWHGPLAVGETIEAEGRVIEVRARGPLNLVTFGVSAGSWLEATSTFLMSAEAAAAAGEEPEPLQDARGADEPPAPLPFPAAGAGIPPMARSASRADLVRYAGASGDWNPLHWDHQAAVAAGLPGVVVHGLLMASWLIQAAARHSAGPFPLAEMRLRFRRPLRPAVQALVTGSATDGAGLALSVAADGVTLVSATARVTG
jgi:acyl dehydratase